MANLFVNLPLPVLNGSGASVSTSAMGRDKTIVASGNFPGATITVEVSVDGGVNFAPIAVLQSGASKTVVPAAAQFMRLRVSGRAPTRPFSATVSVGANSDGAAFFALPLPAGSGAGPAVDVSGSGASRTFVVAGTFPGRSIQIQASENGIDWATSVSFAGAGDIKTSYATARFYRTFVRGGPVTASVSLGASNEPAAPSLATPAFPDFSGTGVMLTALAGVMTLEDSAGLFTPAIVGGQISIAGATTPANNGMYTILSFISPTKVTFGNPLGVTQAFSGTWSVYIIVYRIYVRTYGSDSTGTGTLANPYRTVKRALRDVPLIVVAGFRYIVDCTDLGIETFPPGYAMPPIHGAGQLDQMVQFTTDPWFRTRAAVNIHAVPAFPLGSAAGSTFPLLSAGDSTINGGEILSFTADATDQLFTLVLNVARPSWATVVAGGGDSFTVAAGLTTLTDAAGIFTSAMVGHQIEIAGSTTPANNGTFIVAQFVSATVIRYVNTAAVAEAFPGTWTATIGLLKGAIFRIPNYVNNLLFGGAGDAIVASNTTTTLVLTVATPDTNPVISAANAPFELREQSTTFQGTSGPVGGTGAFNILNLNSFTIGGIRFVNLAGVAQVSLGIRSYPSHYALMYCDLGRFVHQNAAPINPIMDVCYFHGGASFELHGLSTTFRRTLFDAVTQWSGIPDVGYMLVNSGVWQRGTTMGDSFPFGGFQQTPANHNGGGLSIWLNNMRILNTTFVAGTGTSFAVAAGIVTLTSTALFTAGMVGREIIIANSTTPANNGRFIVSAFVSSTVIRYVNAVGVAEAFPGTWIVTGPGIKANAGGTITRSRVRGCLGDAISVDRARGPLRLTRVVGDNNGGIGCNVTNNSVVNIDGDAGAGVSLTTVTGAGGDSKCGANATRTWASFTAGPNENDLAAAGLTSQMCRIYKAP